MITRYLTDLIEGCVGVSDLGGRYEVTLSNGTRRDATAGELAAAQAALDAAEAERAAAAVDIAELKAQFATDRDKLQAIIAAPGGTNANRDAQILDMAQVMRRLLKTAKAQAL